MEAESVKAQYFRRQLEKGIRDIFAAQRDIATQRIYRDYPGGQRRGRPARSRSGRLLEALTNPRYNLTIDGEGVRTVTSLPLYIRFLDMKKKGNYHIYNRQIWGILYSETLGNVKHEYREWLTEHFPELLEQFNNESDKTIKL